MFKKGHPKTGGRKKGVQNKVQKEIRPLIMDLILDNYELVRADLRKMKGVNRVKEWRELLSYAIPKLANTNLDIQFERLSDEDLQRLVETITKKAEDKQNE